MHQTNWNESHEDAHLSPMNFSSMNHLFNGWSNNINAPGIQLHENRTKVYAPPWLRVRVPTLKTLVFYYSQKRCFRLGAFTNDICFSFLLQVAAPPTVSDFHFLSFFKEKNELHEHSDTRLFCFSSLQIDYRTWCSITAAIHRIVPKANLFIRSQFLKVLTPNIFMAIQLRIKLLSNDALALSHLWCHFHSRCS